MAGSQADFWQGPSGTLPVVNANGNIFEEVQVATAAQTVFTLASFTYTVGQKSIWVFRRPVASDIGGEMLRRAVDYTETSSSQITLTAGATVGDILTFIAFGVNQLIAPVVNNGLPQGGVAGAILQKVDGSDYNAIWTPQSSVTTLLDAARSNVASASTVNLVTLQGTTRNINITGVIQIDGFQITSGQVWIVRFSGILTLKNNANIITQTGADVITTANATCILRAISDNLVEVIGYTAPNGPILANSLNTGPFGRRNFLYNGGATNSQRGSQTLAATGTIPAACDGWYLTVSGTTVAATSSQLSGANSSTGFAALLNVTTTGTTNITYGQRIEAKNAKRMSGKTVTVSGRIKHTAPTALTVQVAFIKPNTVDNYGAVTGLGGALAVSAPNGSVDFDFSSQFTFGATDCDNGIDFGLYFGPSAALPGTNIIISNLQLEIGGVATPIEHSSATMADLESKRYLYATNNGAAKGDTRGAISGFAVSTTVLLCHMKYPVAMRVIPTVQLWQNGVQNQIRNLATGTPQANTISLLTSHNQNGFGAIVFTTANLVAGNCYDFDLICSAEL